MQERSVTNSGNKYELDKPFFVLATQNPIEQEGTYPLPEAQLDRFMFNVILDYPTYEEELQIVKQTTVKNKVILNNIMSAEQIMECQEAITKLPVTNNVLEYTVSLVAKTRPKSKKAAEAVKQYIEWGAGPRASQFMLMAAKCHAAINGKYAPDIEDVKAVAKPILRHRIVMNYKAEAEGMSVDEIIESIL
jgi:MoxR-like ATPase